MKRIVVVGGGYAGAQVAQALDSIAEVRLVEPKDRFVHNVAATRAFADTAWLDRMVIPYDRLLKRGRLITGRAVELSDEGVRLSDGRVLEADFVVAATGSTYALPFKAHDSVDQFMEASRAANRDVLRAKAITIVGGGPVGIELAGEIAVAHPGKRVTLVNLAPSLLPEYPSKLGRSLASQLASLNVELRLGETFKSLRRADRPQFDEASSTLIVPAFGARPAPASIPGAQFSANGRLRVDAWLRVVGAQRVFALGDAADTGDPMTIFSANHQVGWLNKLLTAVLAGKDPTSLPVYRPASPGLVVPLGPKLGASVLPLTRKGFVVGRGPTSAIKGKDLFITSNRRRFGYSAAPSSEPPTASLSASISA